MQVSSDPSPTLLSLLSSLLATISDPVFEKAVEACRRSNWDGKDKIRELQQEIQAVLLDAENDSSAAVKVSVTRVGFLLDEADYLFKDVSVSVSMSIMGPRRSKQDDICKDLVERGKDLVNAIRKRLLEISTISNQRKGKDLGGNDKKKPMLKWMFILLNVGLELGQAIFSQEAGAGKIKVSQYRKLCVIFSGICLTLSFVELLLEGMRDGVKWSRNRGCYCFRYQDGRLFGRFPLWFGLISAALQFSLNVASLVAKRGVFEFDPLGLLLSVGYFFTALFGEHTTTVAMVRCKSHGRNEAEGKLVQGVWEFRCNKCPPEKMV